MFPRNLRFDFRSKLPKLLLNSQSFNVRYDKNEEGLRIAVVVSKKVDKRATVRNKVRRKFTEEVRKQTELNTPVNLVFYIKKQAVESLTISKEIEEVINKIKNV